MLYLSLYIGKSSGDIVPRSGFQDLAANALAAVINAHAAFAKDLMLLDQ